jgi:hypothetical protein
MSEQESTVDTAAFIVETKIVTHTIFESGDDSAIKVELRIDDDGDGSFSLDDPDDDGFIQKPVEDLDMLIDMLIQARTIRDLLHLREGSAGA